MGSPRLRSFAVALAFAAAAGSAAAAVDAGVINSITVDSKNVFDPSKPKESKWFYRAANALHTPTRPDFIRAELLVREGDVYDAALVDESERRLRRFNFLRRAWIERKPAPDGTVDLVVHTQDTWTLEPQANFKHTGGDSSSKAGIVQRNFMGTGRKIAVFTGQSPDGPTRSLSLRDPHFVTARTQADFNWEDRGPQRTYDLWLTRPYASTRSRFSWDLATKFSDDEIEVQKDGNEVGRFQRTNRESFVQFGTALDRKANSAQRVGVTLGQVTRGYKPLAGEPGPLKGDIQMSVVRFGYEWTTETFIKERRINAFDRDEDFNVGPGFEVEMGFGQDWGHSKQVMALPGFRGHFGLDMGPGHFAMFDTGYHARIHNDRVDNLMFNVNSMYAKRLVARNTLVGSFNYNHGYRLDPESRLTLGEDSGLRGYPNAEFEGEKTVLMSLEDRMFFKEDVASLFSFGGVAFFDSGAAWAAGDKMNGSSFRSSVGVGFRVAFSRSSRNEPIKIDIAHPLNENGRNSDYVVSVRSGFTFGGGSDSNSLIP